MFTPQLNLVDLITPQVMPSLDDDWFNAVLAACYHNPREEREQRRRGTSTQPQCDFNPNRIMVKPKRKIPAANVDASGDSSKKSTPGRKSEEGSPVIGSRRPPARGGAGTSGSSKKTPPVGPFARSMGTRRSPKVPQHPATPPAAETHPFDLSYAVKQAHLMYTGGDSQELARALFGEPTHPSVTPMNVMDVGRELRINISKKFLAWIGVREEATFSEPPSVTRTAPPAKESTSSSKDIPPLPAENINVEIPEGEPSTSTQARSGEIVHPYKIDRPTNYVPFPNILPDDVTIDSSSWTKVWRDDMRSWELGDRDLKALARCLEGESFVFRLKLKKHEAEYTIFVLCGHVNHGPDFHLVCRGCQLLSTGTLCCNNQSRLCGVGQSLLLVEKSLRHQGRAIL